MKTFIVGQAPSRSGDPKRPIEGRIGRFLAQAAEADCKNFLAAFEKVNVLNKWPGSKGAKGDAFPMQRARAGAKRLMSRLTGHRVILLGRNVAEAFGVPDEVPLLVWIHAKKAKVALLPHPSGVNRWWNSPSNRRAAGRFLWCAYLDACARKQQGGR